MIFFRGVTSEAKALNILEAYETTSVDIRQNDVVVRRRERGTNGGRGVSVQYSGRNDHVVLSSFRFKGVTVGSEDTRVEVFGERDGLLLYIYH